MIYHTIIKAIIQIFRATSVSANLDTPENTVMSISTIVSQTHVAMVVGVSMALQTINASVPMDGKESIARSISMNA